MEKSGGRLAVVRYKKNQKRKKKTKHLATGVKTFIFKVKESWRKRKPVKASSFRREGRKRVPGRRKPSRDVKKRGQFSARRAKEELQLGRNAKKKEEELGENVARLLKGACAREEGKRKQESIGKKREVRGLEPGGGTKPREKEGREKKGRT